MKKDQFAHLLTRLRVPDRQQRLVGPILTSARRTHKPNRTRTMRLLSVRGSASISERKRRRGKIRSATSKNSPRFTMKTRLIETMQNRLRTTNIGPAQIKTIHNKSKRRLRKITRCLTSRRMKMVTLKTFMNNQSLKKNQMRATTPKMIWR